MVRLQRVQGLQAKAHCSSRAGKEARNVLKRRTEVSMSVTPTVSRMECIESEGTPRSTTRSPVLEAMIGPMVVPHGQSFLTMNSCGEYIRTCVRKHSEGFQYVRIKQVHAKASR